MKAGGESEGWFAYKALLIHKPNCAPAVFHAFADHPNSARNPSAKSRDTFLFERRTLRGDLAIDLNAVSDLVLIQKTERLVKDERELLLNALFHLQEIDRRRLYSALGFKSLFDFTVRHLGYPGDQAYRRLSAMRLLFELPEIEEQIGAGKISLTHIGLAQTLFRQEKKLDNEMTHDEKISVLYQIANKPVREAERITLSLSSAPELSKPDRV